MDLDLAYSFVKNLDNTIHKTKLKDTFIDEVIHDLQRYILRRNMDYDYAKLPENTIFNVDYIEPEYASCLDIAQHPSEKYCIPIELLDESAKQAAYIQFNGTKYTAVPNPHKKE